MLLRPALVKFRRFEFGHRLNLAGRTSLGAVIKQSANWRFERGLGLAGASPVWRRKED